MRRAPFLIVVATCLGAGPSAVRAQDWVNAVFPSREHDFGTVARGSKVHHSFKVVNTTNQEIHILTYRTKCGCTEVKLGAQTIPPGTQSVVEAVIDTTKFTGNKQSGLVLVIDRPQYTEVDLSLSCFIRADLTLNPGGVDFGLVNRTSKPAVELLLTYVGGQPDWAIMRAQTLSPHVSARLVGPSRAVGGGVTYALTATLSPTAPVGSFKDEITLTTNDPSSPTIPVSVTATVQSNVSVSPSVINLGQVRAGSEVRKTILARSSQPFKLVGVRGSRPELSAPTPGSEMKAVHPIAFSFKAPTQPGPFHAVLEIETDVKDEPPAKVSAFATVVP